MLLFKVIKYQLLLKKKFNGGNNPGNIHATVMNLVTHDKEIYLKLEVDTLRNKKESKKYHFLREKKFSES
jgi:hypothetical protein